MNKPVSFPIAKLLKEKEFDKPVHSFYVIDESEYGEIGETIIDPNDNYPVLDDNSLFDTLASAPTIADVVMWLYEKHKIWIYVDSHEFGKWCYNYKFNRPHELSPRITENGQFSLEDYNSPTEAYEAAIEYTLNNLV